MVLTRAQARAGKGRIFSRNFNEVLEVLPELSSATNSFYSSFLKKKDAHASACAYACSHGRVRRVRTVCVQRMRTVCTVCAYARAYTAGTFLLSRILSYVKLQ